MNNQTKLREKIINAQNGDKNATYQILLQFNPLIKKYSRILGYDDAYSDLIIWMVQAIRSYNNPQKDGIKQKKMSTLA